MTIYLRQGRKSDLDRMEAIAQQGVAFLARQGSPQWQDGYGPSREQFTQDIEKGESYVLIAEGKMAGVAALVSGVDDAYTAITEGAWDGTYPQYLSIHRVALDGSMRGRGLAGVFMQLLITAGRLKGYRDLRIDTYPKNIIMQKTILSAGFSYAGEIEFDIPHGERKAYQLVLD